MFVPKTFRQKIMPENHYFPFSLLLPSRFLYASSTIPSSTDSSFIHPYELKGCETDQLKNRFKFQNERRRFFYPSRINASFLLYFDGVSFYECTSAIPVGTPPPATGSPLVHENCCYGQWSWSDASVGRKPLD